MHHPAPPVCPVDGKDDTIQKVSSIVLSGTSTGSSSGSIQNSDGSTSYISSSTTTQSRLAQALNQPIGPHGAVLGSSILAYVGLAFLLLFVITSFTSPGYEYTDAQTQLQDAQSAYQQCLDEGVRDCSREYDDLKYQEQQTNAVDQKVVETNIILSVVFLSLLLFRIIWDVKRTPVRKRKRQQWLAQIAKWYTLYYCFRHDVVFIPGQPGVAPQHMKTLLS